MTKLEAVKELASRFRVGAKTIAFEYDPAGSDRTLVPQPSDVAILEALIGRKISEDELWFSVGCGPYRDCYSVPKAIIDEITITEERREAERQVIEAALKDATCKCRRMALSEIPGSALNDGCTAMVEQCKRCAAIEALGKGSK